MYEQRWNAAVIILGWLLVVLAGYCLAGKIGLGVAALGVGGVLILL